MVFGNHKICVLDEFTATGVLLISDPFQSKSYEEMALKRKNRYRKRDFSFTI